MINLKFHTHDEKLVNLAQRYWALSDAGLWSETVEAIAQTTEFKKTQVPKLVIESASAYLSNWSCSRCANFILISNRTAYKRLNAMSENEVHNYVCTPCLLKERDSKIEKQREAEQDKQVTIRTTLEKISTRSFDFSEITFLNAAYCYALQLASDISSTSEIGPIRTAQLFIVPNLEKKIAIFQHLFSDGVLRIGMRSPLSAFGVGSNGVTFYADQVTWCFAIDSNGFDDDIVGQCIQGALEHPDSQSLCNLWQEVAQLECEAYFLELCEKYRFLNWSYTDKVADAVNYALNHYSIPQVWNLMFGEFKNLAALVQAGSLNRKHIENMFSGNLRRRADKWFANSWIVKPWDRRTFEKECYLTSLVFDNLFGGGNRDWDSITLSNVQARADEVLSN